MTDPTINLRKVLIQTFQNSKIPKEIKGLKMGDFDEWDSFGNFNLILAIENEYKIQFDMEELEKLTSVASLQKAIEHALS